MIILLKNILKIIFLSTFIFLCSGCADIDYTLTINKDNSGVLEYLVKLEDVEINVDIYEGIIDAIVTELETNGFVVERTEETVKATKKIENVLEIDELDSLIKTDATNVVRMEKNFFVTRYYLDAKVDLTGYSKTAKELKLDKELKELLDIKFNLNLPVKSNVSNAEIENGKMLTWKLNYGEENIIKVEYSFINKEIVIIPSIVIAVFVLIFVLLKKYKDKKQTVKF